MTFFTSYKDLLSAEMPRMKRAAAVIMLCLTVLSGTFSGILFPNAFSIFFIAATSALTAAVLFMFRNTVIFIPPLLIFPTVAFITHSLPAALFSVAYVIPSVCIAVSLYKKHSKATAIFISSITYGAVFALIYAIATLSGHEIFPAASDFRGDLEIWFSSVSMNTRDGRVPLFTSDAARGLSDYIMLSLPAIFVTAINTVSYLSATIFAFFCRIFYFSGMIPDGKWSYMPEPFSAVIFIISYAVSSTLVPFAQADVIGFAAENMLLILTPAMIIAGEKASFGFAVKHDRRILFVFVSLFLIMLSMSLYLMVFSFLGAVYVMTKPLMPYIGRLFKKSDDDNGDGDGDVF